MAAVLAGKNVIFVAPANRKFRIALIGCGGRGNGALKNHVDAAKHIGADIEVVATADWFEDRARGTGQRYNVPESRCFYGADAYKKLLATNAEVVLIATSPNFRPVHFEAAVNAGKHVFMENKDSQWYNLTLKPTAEDFETGDVVAPPDDIAAVPGREKR